MKTRMALRVGVISMLLLGAATFLMAEERGKKDSIQVAGQTLSADEIEILPSNADKPEGLLARVGRFHVILVHFPIAWIVLAAGWSVVQTLRKKEGNQDLLLIGLAALALAPVVVTGTLHEDSVRGMAQLATLLDRHETMAWVTVGWVAAALGVRIAALRFTRPRWRTVAAVMMIGATLSVLLTAHLGGSMVYGEEFLFGP